RESYRVYEKQIGWLHEAGRDAMEAIWERELGVECYAELQVDLTERDRYQRELDAQHERRELEAAFAVERRPESVLEQELEAIEEELDLGLELGE
ncbi:MAG: hypothetical protein AAFY15_15835, partial [Cyanobacteria bacterium J06648_11]